MIRDNLSRGANTSDATAVASNILYPKTAYIATGKATGSMPDNGAVSQTLDTTTTSYTVPSGYHNGQGTVSITTQSKSATPSTSSQTISPDTGKVLSSVSIEAIQTQTKSVTPSTSAQTITPDSGKYLTSVSVDAIATQSKSATPTGSAQTISPDSGYYLSSVSVGAVTSSSGIGQTIYNDGYSAGNTAGYTSGYSAGVSDTKVGTAGAAQVLSGYTFTNVSSVGAPGSMPNRGAWTTSVTPSSASQTVTIPEGYHNGSGYVSVGASSGGVSQASLIVDEHIDYLQSYTPTLTNGRSYFIMINLRVSISQQGSLTFIVGTTQNMGATGIYKMQGTTNPTFTTTNSGGSGLQIYELS